MPHPTYSGADRIVADMIGGHEPKVWISDCDSAQQKHGERNQTCLAHLARDEAFALEHGSDELAFDLARIIARSQSSWPRRQDAIWPRAQEQHLRAQPPPVRDTTKSYEGRRAMPRRRSRRPDSRRYREAPRRQPL
jgi:hypothetical protein